MLPVDLNLVEYGQKPLRSKAPQSKNDKVEKSPSMKYKGRTKALPSKIQVGQVAPERQHQMEQRAFVLHSYLEVPLYL